MVNSLVLDLVWAHTGESEHFEVWEQRSNEAAPEFRLPEAHYRVRILHRRYSFESKLLFVEAGKDLGEMRFRLRSLSE